MNLLDVFFPTRREGQVEEEDTGYSRTEDLRILSSNELPTFLREKHKNPETGEVNLDAAREEYAAICAKIVGIS